MCNGKLLLQSSTAVVEGGGSKQSGSLFDLLVSKYSADFSGVQMNYLRVCEMECPICPFVFFVSTAVVVIKDNDLISSARHFIFRFD